MQEMQERPASGRQMVLFHESHRRPKGAFRGRGKFAATPLHAPFSVLCSPGRQCRPLGEAEEEVVFLALAEEEGLAVDGAFREDGRGGVGDLDVVHGEATALNEAAGFALALEKAGGHGDVDERLAEHLIARQGGRRDVCGDGLKVGGGDTVEGAAEENR